MKEFSLEALMFFMSIAFVMLLGAFIEGTLPAVALLAVMAGLVVGIRGCFTSLQNMKNMKKEARRKARARRLQRRGYQTAQCAARPVTPTPLYVA